MISTSGIFLTLLGHWVDFTLTKEHLCGEIIKNAQRRPRLFIGSNANLLLANTREVSTGHTERQIFTEKKGISMAELPDGRGRGDPKSDVF
jgi:hypothetical protein